MTDVLDRAAKEWTIQKEGGPTLDKVLAFPNALYEEYKVDLIRSLGKRLEDRAGRLRKKREYHLSRQIPQQMGSYIVYTDLPDEVVRDFLSS